MPGSLLTRFGLILSCGAGLFLATAGPSGAAEDANQVAALTKAYAESAQQLFSGLAAKPGNIVFSPYSIGAAMAMARTGARGPTESEMAAVLKHSLPRAQIDGANGKLLAILNGYDRSSTPPTCPRYPPGLKLVDGHCEAQPISTGRCFVRFRLEHGRCIGDAIPAPSAKILVTNGLMLTKAGDVISSEYATKLREHYAAEIFHGVTLEVVNNWVKQKTQGKIERLLDKLDPDAVSVFLNAVYFKARWEATFDRAATRDELFHLSPSQQVAVPMMHRRGRSAFAARQEYRAVRLPYTVQNLGMIVVLPDGLDDLAKVSARLDATEFAGLLSALRSERGRNVALSMPRFKTRFKVDLVPYFRQAGMMLAFDAKRADFGGMINKGPSEGELMIGAIVHEAVVEVMEEGTEAAAATAVTMLAGSAPPRDVEPFVVDRPFLFYIVDDATGAILFQGRVVDPRS